MVRVAFVFVLGVAMLGAASVARAQCVEGETLIDGRCIEVPELEPRWNFVASGLALIGGGYITAITGVLIYGLNAPATIGPPPCRTYDYGVLSLVPFAHLGMLADQCDSSIGWDGAWLAVGTAIELLGVGLFVFGLVDQRPRSGARVTGGPGGASVTVSF